MVQRGEEELARHGVRERRGRRSLAIAVVGGATTSRRRSSLSRRGSSNADLAREVSEASAGGGAPAKAAPPEEGFSRVAPGGLQALRVPFDSFAGRVRTADGALVSPLRLVVAAVDLTQDYSVFGTQLLEILLQFKWEGAALWGTEATV